MTNDGQESAKKCYDMRKLSKAFKLAGAAHDLPTLLARASLNKFGDLTQDEPPCDGSVAWWADSDLKTPSAVHQCVEAWGLPI